MSLQKLPHPLPWKSLNQHPAIKRLPSLQAGTGSDGIQNGLFDSLARSAEDSVHALVLHYLEHIRLDDALRHAGAEVAVLFKGGGFLVVVVVVVRTFVRVRGRRRGKVRR
jgi:hypothetical protein